MNTVPEHSPTQPPAGVADEAERRAPTGKLTSYWDPLFNPGDDEPFPNCDWDFQNKTRIRHSTCRAEQLKSATDQRRSYPIDGIDFLQCHFRGDFDFVPLTFKNCKFELCDFGYAKWERVKFNKCTFTRCSITMALFSHCEFIECKWSDIGISGTETRISDTVITNPKEFIVSAYTNLDQDVLRQKNTSVSYQTMRLEQTKAKLARVLASNLERHGDDKSYYEAIATYVDQGLISQISEARHKKTSRNHQWFQSCVIGLLQFERFIINLSGKINGWGRSVARPALIGCCIIFAFSILYWRTSGCTLGDSLMTAYDVTLLVGYTKQATKDAPFLNQCLYAANALLGLWWYAVFVPTVINRISRVRI